MLECKIPHVAHVNIFQILTVSQARAYIFERRNLIGEGQLCRFRMKGHLDTTLNWVTLRLISTPRFPSRRKQAIR